MITRYTDGMVQYTNLCQLQEQEQQTFTKVYGASALGMFSLMYLQLI
jgi:hypothetical protein